MDTAPEQPHRNIISGSASLYGTTIQAHEVHGSIHVHTGSDAVRIRAPRQLPPVPANFTNRQSDLASLQEHLRGGGEESALPVVVVSGPAGIGKTTLVSRWLHTLDAEFPDGQLYADLRGHSTQRPAAPGEVLGRHLRALGVSIVPTDLAELVPLWRVHTAGLRIAVFLDNAFTSAQVRALLPGGTRSLVVVTSRRRLSGLHLDGAKFHFVEGLGQAAAVQLLTHGVGEHRIARELPAARQVVALCAGLPLALCLAAARLAARPRQPVQAMADALAPDTGRLAALEVEGEATVSRALDASYAVLGAEAALLYRRLGVLPVDSFDARTAAAACAEPLAWAERRLDELVDANLVEDIGPDTLRFHDLIRVHARARAIADDPEAIRGETLRRVCDWYLQTTTDAQAILTPIQLTLPRAYVYPSELPVPFSDMVGALGWLDERRMNLMVVVRTAFERGWYALCWQLVDALWPLFLRRRHYDLWIEAHRIGLDAARRDGSHEAERQMLNSGAIGLSNAGRTDDAVSWYTASLQAAREAGDVRDEGQALLGLAACRREAGLPDEAVQYLNQAVAVWEGCGYPRGAALARVRLGEIALNAGDPGLAVRFFTQAREALLAVKDPHDAARALAFLGRARVGAGELAAGIAQLEEALTVFTSSGATHWQARTLEMLGLCAHEHGDATAAEAFTARALTLYESTSPADARRLRTAAAETDSPPP